MSERQSIARASLEIELEFQAPRGALISAHGARLPFIGWTELASVIEEWCAAERATSGLATGNGAR